MSETEHKLSNFYNSKGWSQKDNRYFDSILWEDNRDCAKEYVSNCRLRLKDFILKDTNVCIDVGCGPIQYKEYLEYYKYSNKNHFLDLSKKAIEEAKNKTKKNSIFFCDSVLNFKKDNYYDLIIFNHSLYHINKKYQKKAVLNLIKSLKINGKFLITYTNKYSFWNLIFFIPQMFFDLIKNNNRKIYHYSFNIKWWDQFNKYASIKKYPLRSISSRESKLIIPNNIIGKKIFSWLFKMEEKYPKFFTKFGTYYIIEIIKN